MKSSGPGRERLQGNPISDFSIRESVLVIICMLGIIGLGIASFLRLPLALLVPSNEPTIVVVAVYPGARPQTVADEVLKPIEDQIATLNHVTKITGRAQQSGGAVIAQFDVGTDLESTQQVMKDRIDRARALMPLGVLELTYEQYEQARLPVLEVAVQSKGQTTPEQLSELIDDTIVPEVQRAEGIGMVVPIGGRTRQINVELEMARLQSLRLNPAEVYLSVAAASASVPIGSAQADGLEYKLHTPLSFESPQEIANVPVGLGDYKVGDVAKIVDSHAAVDSYVRLKGQDAVLLSIMKQSQANTTDAANAALERLQEVFARYPDLTFTVVQNQADEVRDNVDGALEDVAIAMMFAVLVVWIFFRDMRHTLVTVVGLPIIVAGTFIAMDLLGLSLNTVTLLALSVSVGLVIDDAIVVRENVFRHLELGYSPIQAASRGAAQVVGSVVAMTLTIIVVFLPVINTPGIPGIIFTAFALTVISAMAISLVEAFTNGSAVAALWLKRPRHAPPAPPEGAAEDVTQELPEDSWLNRVYTPALVWSLRHQKLVMAGTAGLMVLTLVLALGVPYSFLPLDDSKQIGISFRMPPGTPLEETDRRAKDLEQLLLSKPNIEHVLTVVGSIEGQESAFFFVTYTSHESIVDFEEQLRPQLADFPQLAFALTSYESGPLTNVLLRPIQVQIRSSGSTSAEMEPYAEQLRAALADVPGLKDLESSYMPGVPGIEYHLKQDVAGKYGLTNTTLGVTMNTLVNGMIAGRYRENGHSYFISVRLRPEDRQSVAQVSDMRLPIGQELLPLGTVATVTQTSDPEYILRRQRQNEILLSGNNVNANINDVITAIQQRIAQNPPPAGVTVNIGGIVYDQQVQGYGSLISAIGIAILLIYMVLASAFRSFTQPFVLMLAMPLSLVGAVVAVRIFQVEVNIVAMVGVLMLLGLVVKNSIMLIEFTNKLKDAGMNTFDALVRGGQVRMRPILMTSAAIIGGNIPIVMGIGTGAELRRGLGIVIIGGMISSTLLTLFVVPVAYGMYDAAVAWITRHRRHHDHESDTSDAAIGNT